MKYKINQQDYDSLSDELKALYKQDGTNYVLQLEGEDEIKQEAIDAYKRAQKALEGKDGKPDDKKPDNKDKDSDDESLAVIKALQTKVAEMENRFKEVQKENRQKTIREQVLQFAAKRKIHESAVDDLILHVNTADFVEAEGAILTKEGKSVEEWTNSLIDSKPLWVGKTVPVDIKGGKREDNNSIDEKRKKLGELLKSDSLTAEQRQEANKLAKEIKENTNN